MAENLVNQKREYIMSNFKDANYPHMDQKEADMLWNIAIKACMNGKRDVVPPLPESYERYSNEEFCNGKSVRPRWL